jgi:polyisoprenyl-teichoic acid--peptidoglycan teichoic acid transferase
MWRRALQMGSLVMAILSLAAFYVVETKPKNKSIAQPNLIAASGMTPVVNIAVAGRDIEYCKPGYGPIGLKAEPCEGVERYGRTDTMMFVRIQPGRVDVVSIPRDTFIQDQFGAHKMNSTFTLGGKAALREAGIVDFKDQAAEQPFRDGGSAAFKAAIEQLLGVTVDYTVVFNVELVQKVIDALGGVDVYVPEPMKWTDRAAGLYIDIPAGNVHLNGEKAVGYLRFRHGVGSDYARMDRGKEVIGKLMQKLKSPAALNLVPTLIGALQNDIITNVNFEFAQSMVGQAKSLTPNFHTLPTIEDARYGSYLIADMPRVGDLMQGILNPKKVSLEAAPTVVPSIINQSGVPRLGRALANYLERNGWGSPEVIPSDVVSSEPTRLVRRSWGDLESAEFYAKVLGTSVSTPYRYPDGASAVAIVLGKDAGQKYGALVLEASRLKPQ